MSGSVLDVGEQEIRFDIFTLLIQSRVLIVNIVSLVE